MNKTIYLISLQQDVKVLRQFITTINGYKSPAYEIELPNGSVEKVISTQVIDKDRSWYNNK